MRSQPPDKTEPMSRIRAIVFDAGGTLLYPAEPVGETYARFARAHGVKIQAEAATTAFRQVLKDASPRTKCATPPEKNVKEKHPGRVPLLNVPMQG
jgi:phosphoglycolate phosphatase-like HAD superfamily hydrolase